MTNGSNDQTVQIERPDDMGKVFTELTITNQDALLGVIPLKALGLEPDLKAQKLKVLPISPTETYLTIL